MTVETKHGNLAFSSPDGLSYFGLLYIDVVRGDFPEEKQGQQGYMWSE